MAARQVRNARDAAPSPGKSQPAEKAEACGPTAAEPRRVQGQGGQLQRQAAERSPSAASLGARSLRLQRKASPSAGGAGGAGLQSEGEGFDVDAENVRGLTDYLSLEGLLPEVSLPGDTGIVDTKSGRLRLREGPSLEDKVLTMLDEGTVMTRHARKGKWLRVKVWSGQDGREGWVHSDYWLSQPDVPNKDKGPDKGEPEDLVYEEITGKAFIGKPGPDQADQGYIGDCYLIAAMVALASTPRGQGVLLGMVKPHGKAKTYTITFKKKLRGGGFSSVPIKVDAWLPAKDEKLRFALNGTPTEGEVEKPLWASLIEKAYATWKGGYDALDEGGSSGRAMKEMAGVEMAGRGVSSFGSDEELLDAIKEHIKKGSAMTAGTRDERSLEKVQAFSGSDPYRAGISNTIVASSLTIKDGEGHAPTVKDDGKGSLESAAVGDANESASGTVNYEDGVVQVDYPDSHRPKQAADLAMEYKTDHWISKKPDICANHAYVVKGATDAGVDLHNPWGVRHPGLVAVKDFRACFDYFSVAALPKAKP